MSKSRVASAVLATFTCALVACGAPPDGANVSFDEETPGATSQAICIPSPVALASGAIPDEPGQLSLVAPSNYASAQHCTDQLIADAVPGWTRKPVLLMASTYTTAAPTTQAACEASFIDMTLLGMHDGTWETVGTVHQQMTWQANHSACTNTMASVAINAPNLPRYTQFRTLSRTYTNTTLGRKYQAERVSFFVYN
jgi:hypothetical protein